MAVKLFMEILYALQKKNSKALLLSGVLLEKIIVSWNLRDQGLSQELLKSVVFWVMMVTQYLINW